MQWKRPLAETTKRKVHAVLTTMLLCTAGVTWTAVVMAADHLYANGHLPFNGYRMALYDAWLAGAFMVGAAVVLSIVAGHEVVTDVKKIRRNKPAASGDGAAA